MASHASFTANNSTAVAKTFSRTDIDGVDVRFQERSHASPLGWWNVQTSIRPPVAGNGSKVYKGRVKFTLPIVVDETINGVSNAKKVREFSGELVLLIPADSIALERADFAALLPNILASATLKDLTSLLLPLNGP